MKSASATAVKKLSGDERRAAIIKAVRQVFAEKGFDGTTMRELALAAGVSEALLFKHFPNKEALYSAMQLACCNEKDSDQIERLKALEPSARRPWRCWFTCLFPKCWRLGHPMTTDRFMAD